MFVVVIVALFHLFVRFFRAFAHVVTHSIFFLVDRDTFRTGICMDCSYAKWSTRHELIIKREREQALAEYDADRIQYADYYAEIAKPSRRY